MIDIKFKNLKGQLFYHHNIARYTSWRVGGEAERFYKPADLNDLQNFVSQLPREEPLTWIGLGSNVLVRDAGISGTVILTLGHLNTLSWLEEHSLVRVEVGVTASKLAKWCARFGFEEAAFFSGIPGTVGGALAMNAGAFGQSTWEYVTGVEMLDRKGGLIYRSPNEFTVGYRQVDKNPNEFFIAAHMRFSPGNIDIAQQKIKHLLKKRNTTQPIGQYSCGSVFRNPQNNFAARLIEQAGLKGHRIGGAEVSTAHANFIINTGNATAKDIESLISYVADRVKATHQVTLVKEVHIIGNEKK